jgi:hypothetical protein
MINHISAKIKIMINALEPAVKLASLETTGRVNHEVEIEATMSWVFI